jgi:hypothetical protein
VLAVYRGAEHLDVYSLADGTELRRMRDISPGELWEVNQAVQSVEVHIYAVLGDAGNRAMEHLAQLEVGEDNATPTLPLATRAPWSKGFVTIALQHGGPLAPSGSLFRGTVSFACHFLEKSLTTIASD